MSGASGTAADVRMHRGVYVVAMVREFQSFVSVIVAPGRCQNLQHVIPSVQFGYNRQFDFPGLFGSP